VQKVANTQDNRIQGDRKGRPYPTTMLFMPVVQDRGDLCGRLAWLLPLHLS